MTKKQQEYLEKLDKFRFYYSGKHYEQLFMDVYNDYEYWEPLLKRDVSTNKTLSTFKTYIYLKRRCCDICSGSGQQYAFDDMTLPCSECNIGENMRFLGVKREKIDGGGAPKSRKF